MRAEKYLNKVMMIKKMDIIASYIVRQDDQNKSDWA